MVVLHVRGGGIVTDTWRGGLNGELLFLLEDGMVREFQRMTCVFRSGHCLLGMYIMEDGGTRSYSLRDRPV